ncbi:MAG TPA: prepilin-type N-terminal cleavage/methylation domain-containing protein [Candidatus Methylomirabilis sp.]|nr:prepilin-type N-terminal cleavage/methylation domain-containing protein [Candidatus Methylomirabilis sp.]
MSLAPSERLLGRWGRGFTLLETLITTVLLSIVMGGVFLLYTTMQNTLSRGELQTDLQQNARVAMDRMVQEIRMAGYDPSGVIPLVTLQPKTAIRAASSGCLSFVADVTGSGTARQVTYDLNGTTLRRKEEPWDGASAFSGGGGAQPLAELVNLLTFTYYDAYNQLLTPYSTTTQGCPPGSTTQTFTQLDYLQMKQIRRVAITLQTRDSRPDVFSQFYTLTSDVRLRNR